MHLLLYRVPIHAPGVNDVTVMNDVLTQAVKSLPSAQVHPLGTMVQLISGTPGAFVFEVRVSPALPPAGVAEQLTTLLHCAREELETALGPLTFGDATLVTAPR